MRNRIRIATKLWLAAASAVALPILTTVVAADLGVQQRILPLLLATVAVTGVLLAWAVQGAARSLRIADTTLAAFARGSFEVIMPETRDDQACEVLLALRKVQVSVHHVNEQINRMSREHEAGDIDVFIDTTRFEGDLRAMAEGVNQMVAAHIGVKKQAMGVFAEFGRGNFQAQLAPLPGKKAFINGIIDQVRGNLTGLIEQINHMAAQHDLGEIDAVIDVTRFDGDFRTMADGINRMVAAHIAVKRQAMGVFAEFGRGNFQAQLALLPGKKAFVNEIVEQVRANLVGLIAEMNHMSREHDAGDIDVIIDTTRFDGDFRSMAEGINRMVDAHIQVKKLAMGVVAEFGR
ncbi:methyl-accepting chemotaxis protein, partial [Xanthomonas sp. Kuri4-2]